MESAITLSIWWKKIMYQNYLYLIANIFVTILNLLSKENFSNNTKHRKHVSKFH